MRGETPVAYKGSDGPALGASATDAGEDGWGPLAAAEKELDEHDVGNFAPEDPVRDDPAPQVQDFGNSGLLSNEENRTLSGWFNVNETINSDWDEDIDWTGFAPFDTEEHHYRDLGAYDYDEDARQLPWDIELDTEDTVIRRARAKAAQLAVLLEITNIAERNKALRFLTELFEHLRHPSTFRALYNLTSYGLDLDVLQAMTELRRVWMERTDWWLFRYRGEVRFLRYGAAFTWALAYRVCTVRWQFTPDMMIDEDWIDEWLTLPTGALGYFSFPEFIAEKVNGLGAEALHRGLLIKEANGLSNDLNDDYDWHRRVSDRYGVIGHSFPILTPYERRPRVLRPGPDRVDQEEG